MTKAWCMCMELLSFLVSTTIESVHENHEPPTKLHFYFSFNRVIGNVFSKALVMEILVRELVLSIIDSAPRYHPVGEHG